MKHPALDSSSAGLSCILEYMVTVYIDGENFRKNLVRSLIDAHLLTSERNLLSYPIRTLIKDVLESDEVAIKYYASKIKMPVGYVPSDNTLQQVESIKEYSRHWVASLLSQQISYIKAGNLKVRSSKPCRNCHTSQDILQEKGVDVRIALDILESAYEIGPENAIIIASSDTDLCPVIHKVQAKGIRVVYLCFATQINRALSAVANETVAISEGKLRRYAP